MTRHNFIPSPRFKIDHVPELLAYYCGRQFVSITLTRKPDGWVCTVTSIRRNIKDYIQVSGSDIDSCLYSLERVAMGQPDTGSKWRVSRY